MRSLRGQRNNSKANFQFPSLRWKHKYFPSLEVVKKEKNLEAFMSESDNSSQEISSVKFD